MELARDITGAAALACFVPLGIKYPLRKLGMDKVNAYMMKLHEGASAGFFLLGAVHAVPALLQKSGSTALKISGGAALALTFWLITACHLAKDAEEKMSWHRRYSLLLTLLLGCHTACAAD